MEQKGHFREPFLYVETKGVEEEKRQLYFQFVERCFDHLLRQSDEYIIATVKRNGSLTSFFFSHLLNQNRSYDLPFDRPEEQKEKEYLPFDRHIFKLYMKLFRIYLNRDRREMSTIKSTFIKIHVFMDIIMMFHRSKRRKKEIEILLKEAYRLNKINFFSINKYFSFLYEEVKSVKDQVGRYAHNRGNVQNLIFKINEFIVAVFCFIKFFHPFNYFDRNENKQTNDLILLRLMFYRGVDVGSFSLSTSAPEILKGEEGCSGSSFLHLVVQTYFEMIHHLYEDSLKEPIRKDLLYLRHLFAQVLTMMIKYILLHGNEKNKLVVVSIIIDMLKQKSEEMNLLYFLRNDMHLCNWTFLQTLVLKDTLDIHFYFYLNELLKVNGKKGVKKMCLKKYRDEIERVMEITNLKVEGVVLKVLRRNNFDVCKAVEEILSTGMGAGTSIQNIGSDGTGSDGTGSDDTGGDDTGGDDTGSDDTGGDGISSGNLSSRSLSSRSLSGDDRRGDDGRRSVRWVNRVECDKPRATTKHRQRNILDVLRERTRMEKFHRRKSTKGRYTNDNLDEENKNKIFDLLDRSSSSDEFPEDGSLEDFHNEVLPRKSYRKNDEHGSGGSDGIPPRGVTDRGGLTDRGGFSYRGGFGGRRGPDGGRGAGDPRGHTNRGERTFRRGRPPRQYHGARIPDGAEDVPKGDGCSDGANRTKRYYMKKTTNKGKSHRRQYDKKMSRGML
ncbi:conserved Plasmodium protein, unknown function [Plasmodium knowlesi strain H]|uniref:Uncharacterized protein n=3 Tax=Plasmodium knowlesi TaxID=5850 RepID=A0A1A7VLP4_PLAKH|nr:conserved Plasmodium protein, unknown function [Plasmodium knowlesi strain H]OTN67751.1 Uncharacterized protein PKNOH_S05380300 [Plasmodium knowlesi]CAA9990394.1 conserved Plasmodium protein, unknown function [Plasmodium knowlesi strain H]SBO19600.1 conserved Plasmodium protein, unknown function [Plasmodium knowlesi strain H]SBO22627.1 conserved Plasmodium protein, unknown function [Plasmodium knowlesi strain H]VVS79868.1 conserved Plasmodium protein, unknown function [Plasmodium knowlesi s